MLQSSNLTILLIFSLFFPFLIIISATHKRLCFKFKGAAFKLIYITITSTGNDAMQVLQMPRFGGGYNSIWVDLGALCQI